MSWYEALPGFLLPPNWTYDPSRWPDYTTDFVSSRLEEIDEWHEIFRLRGIGRPSKRAWAAWLTAEREGKPLSTRWPELQDIADIRYDQARYVYLVPAWRRAITKILTEIDDIEDQLSTILWVLEIISRRWIPLPASIMNGAERVRRTLDCAERIVAGVTPFRGRKSEYGDCLKRIAEEKREKQARLAGLIDWLKQNWGRLLEAAQASGEWFNVGIVLGPIMGFIEEGVWGLAKKTVDNYLIAADALMPGYRDDFWRNAEELSDAIERAWDETWGRANRPEIWAEIGTEFFEQEE